MTNLLKWLDEIAPADQRRLGDLNSAGLLNALQTVGAGGVKRCGLQQLPSKLFTPVHVNIHYTKVTVARGGFPGETLQALRYLLAATEGQSPSAFASPCGPELEAKLAGVLVHACDRELRSLGERSHATSHVMQAVIA